MEIVKITNKNLETYYNDTHGNLYYAEPGSCQYYLVDGYDLQECKWALKNKVKLYYISGPVLDY